MYFWQRRQLGQRMAVFGQMVFLIGLAVGLLTLSGFGSGCAWLPSQSNAVHSLATEPQLRAVWLATTSNLDWPSRPGLPVEQQKQEFTYLLDQVEQMHMNAVVVQIRPMADAFYPSRYAPWSQYLTGVQGQNPGYDPLAFMVAAAQQHHLKFHAWFNPYRVSTQDNVNQLAYNHPARLHPDWLVHYGGALYYNPGIPDVRAFIVKSILEVVHRYNIDAVQLDDYFYPYPVKQQAFPDQATYRRYGAARFAALADWRRDNINQLVHELAVGIKQSKPSVAFGISPFGVWRNQDVDPSGSATHAGIMDYDTLYADTRTWIRHNWIDYIAPQIYWNIGFAPADYETLVSWWSQEVMGSHVQLYIGQAAYRINRGSAAWAQPDQLPNQLRINLRYPQVRGSIFFSLKDLLRNPLGIRDRLTHDFSWQKRAN